MKDTGGLNIHWKDWCWSWSSNTLATWCEEPTHLKRPWCWERLKLGREGDDRGWDGWMASPMRWTWVWVSSGRGWWTGRPGVLQSMGSQGVTHNWAIELNWTKLRVSQVLRVITVSIGKKTEVDTWDLPPLWLRRKMQIVQLHERVAENKRWTHGEDGLPRFGCWLPLGYPS